MHNKTYTILGFIFSLLLLATGNANAQSYSLMTATGVADCNAGLPYTGTVGGEVNLATDLNGHLCLLTSGGSGGSVTQGTSPWVVGGSVSLTGTLPAFAATPAVTVTGTLPAFAATPTVNIGGTPAVSITGTKTGK